MHRLLSISILLLVMTVMIAAQTSNSAKSYFQRAKLRLAQGDLDGAIGDFDAALVFNPRLADAYVNRGVARYQKAISPQRSQILTRQLKSDLVWLSLITTAAMRV
jgi:tetratricopeptide (TPR) repeat protein